ncbi:MFS transporter [Streptomyces antarcticus]|uniref:MFS transporter n=1 Tax=Streptomyces antarcticus TaxID=2996458 RepID=UPI00226F7410|nr:MULTISPECIES: MFS transporter [unclassified Streptomyces]MCY0942959.1 MFS transporter [Streptomyces sp. H34-AA3]MCZ4083081.1 MFS transporter [Streptomyces sp. H34-S5]
MANQTAGSTASQETGGSFARLLRSPGALRLVGSLFILEIGSAMTTVGLPLLVMQRYGLGLEVGFTLAARFLPNILLGAVVGQIVDRYDPRRVAMLAALGSGLVVALFPLTTAMWQIQLLALAIGVGYMFSFPATMALRPRVIPDGSELEGNGLIVTAERIPKLIGPALAGPIAAGLGIGWLFCAEAATAVAAAALLLRLPLADAAPSASGRATAPTTATAGGLRAPAPVRWLAAWAGAMAGGARELVRMVRDDGRLSSLTLTAFTYMVALGLGRTFLAAYSLEEFASVPAMLGYLLAAMGLGGACGALITSRFRGWNQGWVYILGNALEGVCWIALIWTGNWILALALLFVAGVFESIASVVYFAEVQKRLPAQLTGKYYATLVPLSDVFLVAGTVAGGLLVGVGGIAWSAALVGLAMAVPVLLLVSRLVPEKPAVPATATAGAVAS